MNEQRIPRSWLMLALGTSGQAASTTALYGLAYLVPAFQRELGLSLAGAGLLVSCPIFGILLGLIGWGVLADRYGERLALSAGLLIAAAVTAVAATVHGTWTLGALLILVGAAGSSVNSASGRLVIGWFPPDRRGIAMGVRQASQPLGTAVAAAALPPLAHHFGLSAAFGFCAALCGAAGAAIALCAVDPPRPRRAAGVPATPAPYKGGYLWRLHGAAAVLCVPQFVVTGFALIFLTEVRGWSAATAGAVLAVANLAGAGVRLLAGWWSDTVASRIRPMRLLALATTADLVLLAAGAAWDSAVGTAALLLASGLTVSTNGLHNTAVAEYAGPDWAGRALGVHGMGQHAAVVLVPPLAGALIAGQGYPLVFALAAVFPVLAAVLLPAGDRAAYWPAPTPAPDGGRVAPEPPTVEV
ncbi:MFS transporter [Streptomyces sp. NBC_00555]|uniref:MFS transporter n=1 Tax=Streptomyces sp. NBC_00555 TaxID=2903662 RepID=UPI00224DE47D|nr:MFS transporter [Streptomyces sp. NBC_00555]MCX5016091.1 MFS transporter [Streptomyces sp. NBC_00555]